MANDINRLIDMLYERIEDAKAPALKPNMSIVERDEMLDLLDELRAALPVEIKRAQELLDCRRNIVVGLALIWPSRVPLVMSGLIRRAWMSWYLMEQLFMQLEQVLPQWKPM